MTERKKSKNRGKISRKRRKNSHRMGTFFLVAGILAFICCSVYVIWNKILEQKNKVPRESQAEFVPETMAEGIEGWSERKPSNADEFLQSMTLEEKILQMFVITPEALTGVDQVYAAGSATKEAFFRYPVGGIVYFNQNLRSPEQVKDMLVKTKSYSMERSGFPAFLSVDEEGGTVARISGREGFGVESVPDMADIGKEENIDAAYQVGKTIGGYLYQLGFNLDYAPVADAVTNPDNTVVLKRAFGTEGSTVAKYTNAFVKGLEENKVMACLKHFPGHGGTSGDTHNGYAYTERTIEQLMGNELIPFREGIKNGVSFIMAAHIAVPNVTGNQEPASLSEILLTDVLRKQLGFENIIITDALNMEAITESYTSGEAAVKAIEAGADMLLMPENFKEAYETVLKAVGDGQIKESRINQSVYRILKVKMELMKP